MIHLCNLEMLETVVEKTYWFALVPNAVPKLGTSRRYCVDVTPQRFPTPLQVHNCSYGIIIIEVVNVGGVLWM
jgi:hypothetical protein